MEDLGQAAHCGDQIQMLGGGNPAAIPQMESCFRQEMVRILDQNRDFERMIGNYDSPQGNQDFICALAQLLGEQFNWSIDQSNIAITNGSQSSFGVLFNLFSGEFDDGSNRKICLPMTPEYIGYADVGISESDIFQSYQPLIKIDQQSANRYFKYQVDFDHLRIDQSHGAICVSRPTNPTGNVITDKELKKLSALSKDQGIPLIIDGAYGLPFPGMVFNESAPIWDQHIILCLSLSKLGLPGARTGIVIAHSELIDMIKGSNAISNLAPGRFGPSLLTGLIARRELLPLCDSVIRPYYEKRANNAVDLVNEYMKDISVRIHKPEGAMFLWLWFKQLPITSETLYQNLKKRGVYVIAGHHFFPGLSDDWSHKQQCIRVSYAGDEGDVERGIKKIAEEVCSAYYNSDS